MSLDKPYPHERTGYAIPRSIPRLQVIGFEFGIAYGGVFHDSGDRDRNVGRDTLDLVFTVRGRLNHLITYFHDRGRLIVVRFQRKREREAATLFHGVGSGGRIQRGTFNGWKNDAECTTGSGSEETAVTFDRVVKVVAIWSLTLHVITQRYVPTSGASTL